jgi:HSP20 family protein
MMRAHWTDYDRTFAALDEFRRRMDHFFDDYSRAGFAPDAGLYGGDFPNLLVRDEGSALTLTADVPGLGAEDINVTLSQDVLTLSGERKIAAPDGYKVRRQERGNFKFSRSMSMPCPIDPEKAVAQVKDGVLTLRLEKAQEAKPRQITVKSS